MADVSNVPGSSEQANAQLANQKADTTDAAGLLWEQAKAQLADQRADVDALRTRAVAVLSVASLVAGLFGSQFPHNHTAPRTVIALITALVLFAVSVIQVLRIVAPKKTWVFPFELNAPINVVVERKISPGGVALSLAKAAETNRKTNQDELHNMYAIFTTACLLVGLQVVAWAIAVL